MASYFKYRTLNNFERIVDILINHRLFCSNYHQLNDPMEGHFKDSTNNKLLRKEVYDNLDNTYICSASTSFKNVLLWSHYANGHNGICIEFDVKSEQWKPHKVDYVTDLPDLKRETDYKNLLLCKSSLYGHENEMYNVGVSLKEVEGLKMRELRVDWEKVGDKTKCAKG